MKTARSATVAVLLGVALVTSTNADPDPSSTPAPKTDISQTLLLPDTETHPQIQAPVHSSLPTIDDAVATPVIIDGDNQPLLPIPPKPTPGEIEAYVQKQAEDEKKGDWLIREYEEQLQNNLGKDSPDQSTNLYYQLASNKELAKMAGISTLDIPDSGPISIPQTNAKGFTDATQDNSSDAPPTSTSTSTAGKTDAPAFKPLLNPLAPVFDSKVSSPYTSVAYDSTQLGSDPDSDTNKTSSSAKTFDVTNPGEIETPGLVSSHNDPLATAIAAQADPLGATTDISNGLAQGTGEQETREHDLNALGLPLTAPVGTDSELLQKKYADALDVPGVIKITGPLPPNPVSLNTPVTSATVVKASQPNPVRRPIASPLIIPYR